MVGCKDYVHAQMGRKGYEQPRIFRQIIRKTSRILDNFYFLEPWLPVPWLWLVPVPSQDASFMLKMTRSGTYVRCRENSFEGKLHL